MAAKLVCIQRMTAPAAASRPTMLAIAGDSAAGKTTLTRGQHLQLLATGEPILKPIYDAGTGTLTRPELVEPRPCVIVEGLLPLSCPGPAST